MKKLTGASLAKHEVIGAEELSERTSTDRVHGSGLQIHQDCAGHIASACKKCGVPFVAGKLTPPAFKRYAQYVPVASL